ncbi:MAG: hypothetical protein U1F56_09480 [Rubrivivax sp.]
MARAPRIDRGATHKVRLEAIPGTVPSLTRTRRLPLRRALRASPRPLLPRRRCARSPDPRGLLP